ncbi:MAG TPA: nuclear transport factor 2 family protein [Solirubrobacteraceae bacterium]|nr:nuclear transport factor 2 family protein [Solirubrobacteraceae bacterium]
MPPGSPRELVAELHRRQRAMYAGGPVEPVAELLAEDVAWHVPGTSPIAGDHRGREAVLSYFERRRTLADHTFVMHPKGVLEDGDAVVQLVDGEARIGGELRTWSTAGVYRIANGRIAEVWLVPLDLDAFDAIWGGG